MATSNAPGTQGDGRAPPAVFLNPASFVGALAVFVLGSLIVKAVWPGK